MKHREARSTGEGIKDSACLRVGRGLKLRVGVVDAQGAGDSACLRVGRGLKPGKARTSATTTNDSACLRVGRGLKRVEKLLSGHGRWIRPAFGWAVD